MCPRTSVDSVSSEKTGRRGARLIAGNLIDLSTHYFDLLALAWRRRSKQITSYHHDFKDLTDWDARILAYLEALVLLKHHSCPQGLERLSDPLPEEELFALNLLALTTRDTGLSQACVGLVQGMPRFLEPYAAALTWADWPACEDSLRRWPNDDESYQQLCLHALAHHDVALSPQQINSWIEGLSPQPRIRIAALRCAVWRGEAEWASQANQWLETAHPELRLAAAEALIVAGPTQDRRTMLPVLRDLALDSKHPAVSENAAQKLLTVPCTEGQELLEALADDVKRQRLYLESLGWTGDPRAVPLLSERLDHPSDARLAAAAIGTLIGSHPVRDGWQANEPPQAPIQSQAPQAEDALPPPDPDAGLPWPDRELFSRWWQTRCDNWPTHRLYLGGRPREHAELRGILRQGVLAWRPQAAWHLQIVHRGRRFPWRAPAPRQHYHLTRNVETLNG